MRWTSDSPNIGDTRKREGFLWLPKTINGEARWLEHARWEECFGSSLPLDHPDMTDWKRECVTDPMLMSLEWKDFRWLPRNSGTSAAAKPDPPYKRPATDSGQGEEDKPWDEPKTTGTFDKTPTKRFIRGYNSEQQPRKDMDIPVFYGCSNEVVGALDSDGLMRFEGGVPKGWLPIGLEFEVLESHEEDGVRHIDELRVHAFSVSPTHEVVTDD